MAKRKPVEKIKIDKKVDLVKKGQVPSCFNKRRDFCRRDLCGDHFDTCAFEEERGNDHAGRGD